MLTLCDAYGRKFQQYYVYYALVVEQLYNKSVEKQHDFNSVSAAVFLHQVLKFCAPNPNRSDKISQKLSQLLLEVDKHLHEHITKIFAVKGKVASDDNPKSAMAEKEGSITFYLDLWIISAFAAVLQPVVLHFVWDQLFYNKWENKIFEDVCLALLGILKPWLMIARNKMEVHNVFMEEPSLLYFLDVQKAIRHVQMKGNFCEISSMNRNIKHGAKEVLPPPSPVKVTPIPKLIPWVPCDKDKLKALNPVVRSGVHLPFDLYVDSVRFIPDNSTVVKVTGKVLNMFLGQRQKSIKFQMYPELDSCWRYPKFVFKQPVNIEGFPMNPDVVVMLRVYTVEIHSKSVRVLGSCLFGPFSNKHGQQATLRVGGYQVRVRHGVPDPDFNVESMLASHMDNNNVIPGVAVLLRILPHAKEYITPPEYEMHYYRSEQAKPNDSEKKLYKSYLEKETISMSVREKALLTFSKTPVSDSALKALIEEHFPKQGSDVEDFPYERFVDYKKEHGVMILVDKAAGLPLLLEGRIFQCLAQVFPGEDAKVGNGKSQVVSFVTTELELESFQRAPDWSDKPKNVKLDYADRAFILLSLYGLRPRYDIPNKKLLDKEGREPKFNLQQAVAWSAISIFEKGAVLAGVHHAPLIKGRPTDDIIEKLSYLPLDYVCKKFKSQIKVFDTASIEISVWDGHFCNDESPPLPVHTNFLNISSNPSRYLRAAEHGVGATAMDLLRRSVADPATFPTHKTKILELLRTAFKSNLDASLLKEGYAATV